MFGHPDQCEPIAQPFRFEFWLKHVDAITGTDRYDPIKLGWFTFSFFDFDLMALSNCIYSFFKLPFLSFLYLSQSKARWSYESHK